MRIDSANNNMNNANSVRMATRMQGRANILKAEMKQGGSTETKEAELADLE